jgi:enoyl ACP reductase
LDVTDDEHLDTLAERVREHVDGIDGVLHAIGFAPASCLGGGFLEAPWSDVATALHVSAYSLKSLAVAALPLFPDTGGAIVGLDFDARVAWPAYDWMGVAKAALESTSRYLARELGSRHIRVNLVAAGPLRTMAARSIPGFATFEDAWDGRAPLGWDNTNAEPVARSTLALLSDWFPATTGELIHVDGGFHAIGV